MPLPNTIHRIIELSPSQPMALLERHGGAPAAPVIDGPLRRALRGLVRERLQWSDPTLDELALRRWTAWELRRLLDGRDLSEQDWALVQQAAELHVAELLNTEPFRSGPAAAGASEQEVAA